MMYEAAMNDGIGARHRSGKLLSAAVLVGFGVLLGVAMAEFNVVPNAPELSGLNSPAIPGEDWHGNVRRSGTYK